METEAHIRIVAVLGTVRPGSYTGMALALVADELRRREGVEVVVVEPAGLSLPFPGRKDETGDAERLRQQVAEATGVLFATPEYHGGFSAVTKLVIENLGFPSVLAGKPVALLGVAAGRIGAIKSLESLRGVCSHVGAIVLPGSVSIAGVRKVFDAEGRCLDEAVEERIRSVADHLLDYIHENICPRLTLEAMIREGSE